MALVGFISVLYQGFLVRYIRAHLDEQQMLFFAFGLLTMSFIGFAWTSSVLWLIFWIAFFPIGMGSFNPSIGSLLSKNAGKEVGKVMGYNTSIQSIGQIF
jgi:MFS family permease